MKRQNRWNFRFDDQALPDFAARTSARPSGTQNVITIDFLNSKRYLAGKFEWNTIAIGLYDPIAPSSSQKVMEWVRLAHETITGRDGYAAFYKKNFSLYSQDPVGTPIEEWEFIGAWVTDFDFGPLDYGSDEPQTIDLTIRYDAVTLLY